MEGFHVRLVPFKELDAKTHAGWVSLEERALENNAYLSSRFIRPAVHHLSNPKEIDATVLLLIEKSGGGTSDLVGLGVFVVSGGDSAFPLPHLRAYSSIHSYLTGLLLDRNETENAVRSFFRFFYGHKAKWHGISFVNVAAEGPQVELISSIANECGFIWHESVRSRRAIFAPAKSDTDVSTSIVGRRAKELRRLKRRLEELGEVRWKAFSGTDVSNSSIERFLEVEHMGWKGDNRTSLRSIPAHEAFFREMIAEFREAGQVFFTELSLQGTVIASTANLISGGSGFAFKVGWDPAYSKMAPGLLNEWEFIRSTPSDLRYLDYIDSGAEEGSFIEGLWSGRRTLTTGVFGTTPFGRMVLLGVKRLRRFRRWYRSFGHGNNQRKSTQL
jgi:hypothetical protein